MAVDDKNVAINTLASIKILELCVWKVVLYNVDYRATIHCNACNAVLFGSTLPANQPERCYLPLSSAEKYIFPLLIFSKFVIKTNGCRSGLNDHHQPGHPLGKCEAKLQLISSSPPSSKSLAQTRCCPDTISSLGCPQITHHSHSKLTRGLILWVGLKDCCIFSPPPLSLSSFNILA